MGDNTVEKPSRWGLSRLVVEKDRSVIFNKPILNNV